MTDVDATWDGEGSLDDHRQKAFETLQQQGFGKAAQRTETKQAERIEEIDETA